jgi:hypothetical protein
LYNQTREELFDRTNWDPSDDEDEFDEVTPDPFTLSREKEAITYALERKAERLELQLPEQRKRGVRSRSGSRGSGRYIRDLFGRIAGRLRDEGHSAQIEKWRALKEEFHKDYDVPARSYDEYKARETRKETDQRALQQAVAEAKKVSIAAERRNRQYEADARIIREVEESCRRSIADTKRYLGHDDCASGSCGSGRGNKRPKQPASKKSPVVPTVDLTGDDYNSDGVDLRGNQRSVRRSHRARRTSPVVASVDFFDLTTGDDSDADGVDLRGI